MEAFLFWGSGARKKDLLPVLRGWGDVRSTTCGPRRQSSRQAACLDLERHPGPQTDGSRTG